MINIVAYRSTRDGYNSDLRLITKQLRILLNRMTRLMNTTYFLTKGLPSIFFVRDLRKRVHELAEIKREQEAQIAREIREFRKE